MRLEHESEEVLKRKILDVLRKHIQLADYRVFIFGSRVSGQGDERSDIDVGIQGASAVPIEVLGDIREEMENLDTLYKIDVVDFSTASDRFRQAALQRTETIN